MTPSRKSTKHRALAASREKAAKAAGCLHEWYIARDIAKVASRREFVPSPVMAGQYPGMRQPSEMKEEDPRTRASKPTPATEREAWDAAYSGPEVGPAGGAWPEDSTGYSRFMVWRLPTASDRRSSGNPPRNNF
jgi:hypothetical protein